MSQQESSGANVPQQSESKKPAQAEHKMPRLLILGMVAMSFVVGGIAGYTKRVNEDIGQTLDNMSEKAKESDKVPGPTAAAPGEEGSTAGAPVNLHDLPRAKPIWATGKQFLQRPGDDNRYCLSWWDGLRDPCSVKLTMEDPQLLPTETEFYVLDKKDKDGNVIGLVITIPAEHQPKLQPVPLPEETEK